jgi:hypothetical protein
MRIREIHVAADHRGTVSTEHRHHPQPCLWPKAPTATCAPAFLDLLAADSPPTRPAANSTLPSTGAATARHDDYDSMSDQIAADPAAGIHPGAQANTHTTVAAVS